MMCMCVCVCVCLYCVCSFRAEISTTSFLNLRYEGTDCALMVTPFEAADTKVRYRHGNFKEAFTQRFS